MKSIKVLLVTTSNDKLGDTNTPTGVWLEEFTAPYYIFKDAGIEITVASPKGGTVPLDPKSQSIIVATQSSKRFLKDDEAMNILSQSIPLQEIKAGDFDMVFIAGGHGPLWDLADNKILNELLEEFNREEKPIGAVCHGVVALLSLHNHNGEHLVKGKRITVMSTGIGPDNIDIVMNELDALVNIDLETRQPKENLTLHSRHQQR